MSVTKIERAIINSLRNAALKGEKESLYMIRILGLDAIKELLTEDNFYSYIRYINDNVKYKLAESIINEKNDIPWLKSNEYYLNQIFLICNYNLRKQIFQINPSAMIKCLISTHSFSSYSWKKMEPVFLKELLNAVVDLNDISFYSLDDLLSFMTLLNDVDKAYFLGKFSVVNDGLLEKIFDSFNDKEMLKAGIKNALVKSNWHLSDVVLKFAEPSELFQFIDTYQFNDYFSLPALFEKFSDVEKIRLIDLLVSQNPSRVNDTLARFIDGVISSRVAAGDYSIFNVIGDIFNKNNVNDYNVKFDDDRAEFLKSFSDQELLDFYKNCKWKKVCQYITSKPELWCNDIFLSYLFNNEIKIVYDFLTQRENLFDKLSDDVKEIFYKRDNVLLFLQNPTVSFINLNKSFNEKIREFFLDKDFCFEVLDKRMELLSYILRVNPDIEIFKYAIENGYYPEKNVYSFSLDKPEFYVLWFNTLEEFDYNSKDFPKVFNSLATVDNSEVLDLLIEKASANLDISVEHFYLKFNALKSVNRDILSTFDYRLFHERFSFLNVNKIEMIAAHKDVTNLLCELNDAQLNVVKNIMNFSSDATWVDLLDRVLNNIANYDELVLDLYDKELDVDVLNNMILVFSQSNSFNIKTFEELCNYSNLVSNKVHSLVEKGTLNSYKEAISLSLLGLNYEEFLRIDKIYCFDLDNFSKLSDNKELVEILTLIKNVVLCDSLDVLQKIFKETPKVLCSSTFLVNLDSEIRKEFTKFYNNTLYHVSDKDKFSSCYFKEKVDGDDVSFVPSTEGIEVSLYDPSSLLCGGTDVADFGLMMTSLGAYSDHSEPDDYYASWNIDLIASHGFCCSYLTPDNLGTARICHACLGFSDFDMGTLLLSAPYDIGSSSANMKFNTTRNIDTLFCTPRGMVNNTRHTHNEVVWERRNFTNNKSFKKEPSYIIFFCENFDSLTDSEKKIYNSSVKAAIQLGKDKPLPILVIDRSKIAEKNRNNILDMLNKSLIDYKPGDIQKIICSFYNNRVGNTYCSNVLTNYFGDDFLTFILDFIQMKITDLFIQGKSELASSMYLDYCNSYKKEINSVSKDKGLFSVFEQKFNDFEQKMDIMNHSVGVDNPLLSDMIAAMANMVNTDCKKRWNSVKLGEDYQFTREQEFVKNFFNKSNIDIFRAKLDELIKLNIYVPNTPYDNRHIANMLLYAFSLCDYASENDLNIIFDSIIYQTCSYMDGREKMNLDSSLVKAEKLMLELGYDKKRIDTVKLLMLLKDKKDLSDESIKKTISDYNLNVSEIVYFFQRYVPIIHDVECLEHTRFVTAGELSKYYFFDDKNFNLAKVAYLLQEGYAKNDLDRYISENVDKVVSVREQLKQKNPQEVIRDVRKNRVQESKHVNNSFEDAFLEIDVNEKMDPLGFIANKMDNFGHLPKQVSILEFFKSVSESEYYEYLINKISSREDLYLNLSAIHGETHANNVSLFSLYIANRKGLNEFDIKTLIEAAVYHDIGRESDHNDKNHGVFGAIKYGTKVVPPQGVSSNEVRFLIDAHALTSLNDINVLYDRYEIPVEDRERLYIMSTIIRDADALDRTRFRLLDPTNNLDVSYLVNNESKEIIESCLRLNYIIYQDYVLEQSKQRGITL